MEGLAGVLAGFGQGFDIIIQVLKALSYAHKNCIPSALVGHNPLIA